MVTICDGLTVLELGSASMAASMVGMVLADNGARVVKIEPPEGDRLRTENPSGFLVWNRGKESVVLDLRAADGPSRFREMASDADVVVEAFSPGVADGWDVGWTALRAVNSHLVYCAISGFGPTGPYAGLKGYEALVAAKMGVFARGEFAPRSGPIMFTQPSGGYGAALQATAGIAAALIARQHTGRGQRVDATLVQGLDPLDYYNTMITQAMWRAGKDAPVSLRAGEMTATRYAVLGCTKDGSFIQTSTLLAHQAQELLRAVGLAHILDDPKYARAPVFATAEDAQDYEDLIWEVLRTKDRDEWVEILLRHADVPFEVAVTSEEGMRHPQMVHNAHVICVDDPDHGPVEQVGPIAQFSETPSLMTRSAPALGGNDGQLTAGARPGGEAAWPEHPLSGITVVEFGCFFHVPFGMAMTAALGARVIKLEDASGDPMRAAFGHETGAVKTMAGKESLSIDLRTPKGQAIAHELVVRADAFVLGFRPGVAEKLGLDVETLLRVNPRLLYLHAVGYGVDGPYAHRALYAQAAQAVAGSFGRQVRYWMNPEINRDMSVLELSRVVAPRLSHVVDGDSNASLATHAALVLGLLHQRRTGRGQYMWTTMLGGNAYAYSDDLCRYRDKPSIPTTDAEYMGLHALYRLYQAAPSHDDSGWVCLVVPTQKEWMAFTDAAGRPDLAADGRFATPAARAEHDLALVAELKAVFRTRTAAEWEADLSAADVGCVVASTKSQAAVTCTDTVLRETGLTIKTTHPLFGEIVRAAPQVALSETPARVAPSCLRGEHNLRILAELGYDARAIDTLIAERVVFQADDRDAPAGTQLAAAVASGRNA